MTVAQNFERAYSPRSMKPILVVSNIEIVYLSQKIK